jgi:hypothetical protein
MTNSSDVVAGTNATASQYNLLRDDVFALEIDMARQALINGNFDIWQRNTTLALSSATIQFVADRWLDYHSPDSGTLPTLTRSRQAVTNGELTDCNYYSRLATNGAGTSLGASSLGIYTQRIERGNRFLGGAGKQVTITFWARQTGFAGKNLGLYINQNYGQGGSPTAQETINGDAPITLTTSWVKYTKTFTLNTHVGKTFGDNLDDYLEIVFVSMWGSSNASYVGAVGAETYGGTVSIDLAKVQVNAGSESLDFKPRHRLDELRMCERYYQKSFDETTVPAQATGTYNGAILLNNAKSSSASVYHYYRTKMRPGAGTVTTYNPTNANANWYDANNGGDRAVIAPDIISEQGFRVRSSSFTPADNYENFIHWTAERELA